MKLVLIMVGCTERGYAAQGLEHYLERIGHFAPVEERIVAESRAREPLRRIGEESAGILAAITAGDRVVVLDERGTLMGSPDFARRLARFRDQGTRRIVFVTGGAYGMNDAVRTRADLVLALSPMVFPHQLVRVVLAEQIYRAFTILAGRGYHHGPGAR